MYTKGGKQIYEEEKEQEQINSRFELFNFLTHFSNLLVWGLGLSLSRKRLPQDMWETHKQWLEMSKYFSRLNIWMLLWGGVRALETWEMLSTREAKYDKEKIFIIFQVQQFKFSIYGILFALPSTLQLSSTSSSCTQQKSFFGWDSLLNYISLIFPRSFNLVQNVLLFCRVKQLSSCNFSRFDFKLVQFRVKE